MPLLSLQVIASLLQLHGPDATIQSDHQGIDALLGDVRSQLSTDGADVRTPDDTCVSQVAFRRGSFRRGGSAFRRGGFGKGY